MIVFPMLIQNPISCWYRIRTDTGLWVDQYESGTHRCIDILYAIVPGGTDQRERERGEKRRGGAPMS